MGHRNLDPEEDNLTQRYTAWRSSSLGSITERLEIAAVFEMLGPIDGKRLLDVGCGDGIYSVEAARRGARVTGLDLSEDMLSEARKRSLAAGVTVDWQLGDALRLPFPDGSFDIAMAVSLLCLVPDPGAAICEMARVVAPGGRVVLADLHRWSLVAAKRRIRGWGGNEFWLGAHFWTAKELLILMARAGITPGRKRGVAYFPPANIAARLLSPVDPLFTRLGTLAAAFWWSRASSCRQLASAKARQLSPGLARKAASRQSARTSRSVQRSWMAFHRVIWLDETSRIVAFQIPALML